MKKIDKTPLEVELQVTRATTYPSPSYCRVLRLVLIKAYLALNRHYIAVCYVYIYNRQELHLGEC
jgi:hypothetical protein